jgi:hypothetical protein
MQQKDTLALACKLGLIGEAWFVLEEVPEGCERKLTLEALRVCAFAEAISPKGVVKDASVGATIGYVINTNQIKPPLGIKSQTRHNQERRVALLEAIIRHEVANKPILQEWITELTNLQEN